MFATLHTNSAAQTIDRIVDVFPPYQQQQVKVQLANVLSAVMTQQLMVRKNGDGLVLASEVMLATPAIKNLIREGKTYQIQSVLQTNTAMGMMTMDQSLKALYERGAIMVEADGIRYGTKYESFFAPSTSTFLCRSILTRGFFVFGGVRRESS